jgi:hypothetical protein
MGLSLRYTFRKFDDVEPPVDQLLLRCLPGSPRVQRRFAILRRAKFTFWRTHSDS